jgi:Retinal pigment epithelial membrane protein
MSARSAQSTPPIAHQVVRRGLRERHRARRDIRKAARDRFLEGLLLRLPRRSRHSTCRSPAACLPSRVVPQPLCPLQDRRRVAGRALAARPGPRRIDFAANTRVIAHARRTLATVESGPLPYELSDELATLSPCDFGGTLPGGFAAHTKADRRTGELHAIAYFWRWDHVRHVIVDATGRVSRTTDIAVADRPMMHDFALAEHYVLLFDLPVAFSMDAVAAGRELPTRGTRRTIPRSVGPTGWGQGRSAVKPSTLFPIIAVVANALLVAVLGTLYLVGETSGAVVAALGA